MNFNCEIMSMSQSLVWYQKVPITKTAKGTKILKKCLKQKKFLNKKEPKTNYKVQKLTNPKKCLTENSTHINDTK